VCNPKLLVFVFMSLLMTGCTDQIGEEVGSQSIALQETDWNSFTRGKTSGPIQFRYRLEEHEGRLFKLRIFARSAVGGLEGWNIDVVENGLKLAEGTTALLKANGADSSSVVSRRFEFRDEASEFEAVAVKVEVVVGNQLASKTFKVKLGPDSETAVEICGGAGSSCERTVPAVMDIGVGRKR
jgi:hypothetical protein